MTNEEHIEEILITAHEYGSYKQVLNDVDEVLKTNKNVSFYSALTEVFYKYVEMGKIKY